LEASVKPLADQSLTWQSTLGMKIKTLL